MRRLFLSLRPAPAAIRGTSGPPRHTKLTRYRCSLPGLAGFAGNRCTEPEVPPIGNLSRKNYCFTIASRSLAQRSIALKQSAGVEQFLEEAGEQNNMSPTTSNSTV